MGRRSPSPEGRAESREARTGVGSPRVPARLAAGRPASELSPEIARRLRSNMTPQEAKLWVALRKLRPTGIHFRRQVTVGRYVVDFACLKHRLVVEVDGGQHSRDDHVRRDRERDESLGLLGFTVLRFWNAEVDRDLSSVLDTILARLQSSRPHPGPSLRSGSALPSGEGERAPLL